MLGDMLADALLAKIDDIEFVRAVAVAWITMPASMAAVGGAREHEQGDAGLVFLGWRELDLHRG